MALSKGRNTRVAAGFLALFPLAGITGPCAAAAQGLPFEEKGRYERALEQKADEVLVRLLGPNQAKVVVEATMDFSRTEKMEVSSGESREKSSMFKWRVAGGEAQSGDYLLPGFPDLAAGPQENKSYSRQMVYPAVFVKRMAVSVILNRDLAAADAENIKKVVSEILMLDPGRGDRLSVIKAPFAPVWRTVWYTPEAVGMVFKYLLMALMGIIGVIAVSVGFLKLAGAMSTMAKVQQSHQITMELGKGAEPGGEGSDIPGLDARQEKPRLAGQEAGVRQDGEKVRFNVRPDQVPFLIRLMTNEDPANVALIAGNLPPEVRAEFLKGLPPAFASEIILHIAKIRFVEPEVIVTLKEELERRLNGAVGGLEEALAVIESISIRARRDMLSELERKQPELAAEVRRKIFMPEDIAKFNDREASLIAGAVKVDEWAAAMFELPDPARQKIKSQMAERTWLMIEQAMSYGAPSASKVEEALERVAEVVGGLMKEGRISVPAALASIGAEARAE